MHEIKFDGYRLLARVDRGRVTLKTRSGLDWTPKFPSLKKALEALPVVTAFLDGEVMVESESGTPDFAALQADLSEGRSDRFQYYLFDLLHLDGSDLRGASLLDRKAALARLLAGHDGGPLRYSEHFTERGEVVLRHACRLSLEGIVSKLASAPYRSGRTKSWLKSKCVDSDEFVIIGYVPSTTQRRVVGSLVLGYYDKGKLVYAGRVGSGFSTAAAEDLWRRLDAIRIEAPALDALPPRRSAPQRALDQAVAGGRGGAARLDGGRHRAPRRLQGAAPGQAGRRCLPGEARHEPGPPIAERSGRAPRFASPIPTACCGPTWA